MKVLVTGAAGFIGSYVSLALLERGHEVVGVDNINAYYDPSLKHARLGFLNARDGFSFLELDLADHDAVKAVFERHAFQRVVHLAAQAGVRYSLENPFAYARSNLLGHLSVLECVRHAPERPFLVYASSSSVYGNDTEAPFSEAARADQPVSLYAATKRADELMSQAYTGLYGIHQVGLRFFTVYGPWGRPDMAYWLFADRILKGEPIKVFNHGDLRRDFTWIDDIVDGVLRIVTAGARDDLPAHRVYNIGNNKPEKLLDFITALERALGVEAKKTYLEMQPGDVYETAADITAIKRDYGFEPTTSIDRGLGEFADWFRAYKDGRAEVWRRTAAQGGGAGQPKRLGGSA